MGSDRRVLLSDRDQPERHPWKGHLTAVLIFDVALLVAFWAFGYFSEDVVPTLLP